MNSRLSRSVWPWRSADPSHRLHLRETRCWACLGRNRIRYVTSRTSLPSSIPTLILSVSALSGILLSEGSDICYARISILPMSFVTCRRSIHLRVSEAPYFSTNRCCGLRSSSRASTRANTCGTPCATSLRDASIAQDVLRSCTDRRVLDLLTELYQCRAPQRACGHPKR